MKRFIGLAVMAAFLACAPAVQASQEDPAAGDFTFTIAPYAWLTGLYGTVGVGHRNVQVDASFADLSKYLNFAAMIHADIMYRDAVGLLAEFNYALLGDKASGKRVCLDGQMGLILSDVAGVYRLGTFELGQGGAASASFDLTGGVRIWQLSTRIESDNFLGSGRSVYASKSWVDPTLGARALIHAGKDWSFDFRGGVGGFGLTSAITWDAMALAGYSFWEHGTVLLGYRAVGVNHTEGSGRDQFRFDAVLAGPIVGLAFTF